MDKTYDTRNPKLKDPYEILGIPKSASQEEIKAAWRREGMASHSDRGKITGASGDERFMEVNWAYEVLNDPEIRKAFDRYGLKEEPKYSSYPPSFFQYRGGFF